jgi:predicted ATP-grasp superfamily ATP-dependent carboligase
VLVLDCYYRGAVGVLRALDPAYELFGATAERPARSIPFERVLRSPRLRAIFTYPDPLSTPDGFRQALMEICRRHELDAVLPVSSSTLACAVAALADEVRGELSTVFAVEERDKLARLADKRQTYELCRELEIPTPRTVVPDGCEAGDLDGLRFPVVAKPRLAEGSHGIVFLSTAEELAELLRDPPAAAGNLVDGHPYVLQEYVPGQLHDVCACAQDGRPVSLLTQRRWVTAYSFGGPGVVNQTTHEPVIAELARRLLTRLRWNGPLLIDFVRDEHGRFLLLECNPRIWGMVDLTLRAGLNVAQQAIDVLVLGKEVEPVLQYPVGLTYKWLSPDVLARGALRSGGPNMQAAPVAATRPTIGAVCRRRPPGPTITNLRRGDFLHLLGMRLRHAS